jgi:hypothetical protein
MKSHMRKQINKALIIILWKNPPASLSVNIKILTALKCSLFTHLLQ